MSENDALLAEAREWRHGYVELYGVRAGRYREYRLITALEAALRAHEDQLEPI